MCLHVNLINYKTWLINQLIYHKGSGSSILILLNTNTYICDFDILLKGFISPSVVDIYATTFFHQFLILDLVPIDVC